MKAIVAIPVHKAELDPLEELSLSRCVAVLGGHAICVFGPSRLNYERYFGYALSASRRLFDEGYFISVSRYSQLLLSRSFYEQFSEYDYILIHQLDAFVFRDALQEWCDRGYDYVGAPWVQEGGSWLGVGNGGFSLRRVKSCLDVLSSSHKEEPQDYWAMVQRTTPDRLKRVIKYHRKLKRYFGLRDDVASFLRRFIKEGRPEDIFWGLHAVRFHKPFRVAPPESALEFAIEGGLPEAYASYVTCPPFGCHQRRFLRMTLRYLQGVDVPESDYESLVWDLVRKGGLSPRR